MSGRRAYGVVYIQHRGHSIPTTVGSKQYENTFGGLQGNANFANTIGNIPIGYAHRPDLISNLWAGTPGLWWLICEQNNIFDVFEQLKSGDRIYLPG